MVPIPMFYPIETATTAEGIPAPWWAYIIILFLIFLFLGVGVWLIDILFEWFDGNPLRQVLINHINAVRRLRWK